MTRLASRPAPNRPRRSTGEATGLAEILARVQRLHPELSRAWFGCLRAEPIDGGVLRIRAENQAQLRHLTERCLEAFNEASQAATGRLITVRFFCEAEESVHQPASLALPDKPLNDWMTFGTLVVGPHNEFAHAAAMAVSQGTTAGYNPLFIYGPEGIGKTHLLQAVAHALGGGSGGSTIYRTAEAWTNEWMACLEADRPQSFRSRYRCAGALILDDFQELAEREQSQEELFHTVNALLDARRPIVLAASVAPKQLVGVADRLTSRFAAGLVAAIDEPDLETKQAILRRHANLQSIELPDGVVRFLADAVGACGHQLVASLERCDLLARLRGCPITAAIAEEAVRDTAPWIPQNADLAMPLSHRQRAGTRTAVQ